MAAQEGEGGDVGLAAYSSRLSGRPGETIGFRVSSARDSDTNEGNNAITARLTRCICADPNPAGPGCIEHDASEHFEPRTFAGRHQDFRRGSHARSRDAIRVPDTTHQVSVEVWVFPTHIVPKEEHDDGEAMAQCVWSWGEMGLHLMPGGCLSFCCGGISLVDIKKLPLVPNNKWYNCTVTISQNNCHCKLSVRQQDKTSKRMSELVSAEVCLDDRDGPLIPNDAHFELATGGTFNGRLEDPKINIGDGSATEHQLFVGWDTSKDMTEWSIPSIQHDNPLVLYNHPTRAVRGRKWDGTDFSWKHAPSHYGGVHFHNNDIYDFGWESDMEWIIPDGIPSGVYIMRFVDGNGKEEALPLFVCPPLRQKRKKICILMSTFTYVMYGNHARADFKPSWLDRIKDWNAYPHNPSQHTNYGCSTYNFHIDGSGICFASHLRPLFNLRPGYLTFGDSSCSGLRHFPADTHLIAWMHHHNIDYDIVTDHELHKDGVAAIAGYQTLMTGTHPEYHTQESLNALQEFRDTHGGNLIYLGGNGFYWRVAAKDKDASMLEIRRAEDGVRTWASEPGEYHHMLDGGNYGGLWRRNDRPPQMLVGVGFTAQGSFVGMPYKRLCFRLEMEWLFKGIKRDELLGNFGFSGNGAAGFELDRADRQLDGEEHEIIILAQSYDVNNSFMLVPEEVLTTYSNLAGSSNDEARRSDMVYFQTGSGAKLFSVGSITFCGCLPWNSFDNNISTLLQNVVNHFSSG